VIAPRAGHSVTLEPLTEHCRGALAGYKLPRRIVVVEAVERTPAGKPNYRWAKETALAAVSGLPSS
jgi:fatty-acyl-CoA synthase